MYATMRTYGENVRGQMSEEGSCPMGNVREEMFYM